MNQLPKMCGVIRLKNLVYRNDGTTTFGTDDVTRFYNKNEYDFLNPIHEQISPIDRSKLDENLQCFLLPMEVVHHGYAISDEEMKKKQERNLNLLYKAHEKNPTDPYICFQIGQSEYILNHYEKSVEFYEKAMAQEPSTQRIYVQVMVESLARAYMKVNRPNDAIALLEHYDGKIKTAKFYFSYACILYELGQHLKALLIYIKTTTMADVDTLGDNQTACYERIISLYKAMGNAQMAEQFQEQLRKCQKETDRVTTS